MSAWWSLAIGLRPNSSGSVMNSSKRLGMITQLRSHIACTHLTGSVPNVIILTSTFAWVVVSASALKT